jgi:hypothetical protein
MRYGAEVMSAHLKRSPRHLGRLLALSLVAASVAAPAASVLPVALPSAAAADGLGAGGEYHPLAPARIYDSRATSPVNEPAPGPKPANGNQPVFDIPLLGQGGVPASGTNVLAVVVNITVTEPTAAGWLNAYGKDAPAGTASIVNFSNTQTVPNLSIVRPGTDGKLTIKLFSGVATGTAQVVVDVFGWFSTSANPDRGARLVPISPGRVLDTREGAGTPLGQQKSLDLQIRGATLNTNEVLPSGTDIVGVVLNLTGVNDTAGSLPTFLSVVPDAIPAGTAPTTSNLNLAKGQVKPNMVIVPVGADGKVRIFNNTGTTHVVVDVVGYLQSGIDVTTRKGRVVPLTTPYRVFDTRETQWGDVPLGPGQAEDWSFADFASSVNINNVAVGKQMAVIGNLTAAGLTRQYPTQAASSYLTVYPADAASRPIVSNLNTVEGPPVPNLAILKYSSATTVRVYNLSGYADYLYDASAVVLDD